MTNYEFSRRNNWKFGRVSVSFQAKIIKTPISNKNHRIADMKETGRRGIAPPRALFYILICYYAFFSGFSFNWGATIDEVKVWITVIFAIPD